MSDFFLVLWIFFLKKPSFYDHLRITLTNSVEITPLLHYTHFWEGMLT